MPVSTRAAAIAWGAARPEDPLPSIVSPDVSASKRRYSQTTPVAAAKVSPAKKKKAKKGIKKTAPKPFRPPSDWKATYELVRELRQDRTAPCDRFGCEALMNLAGPDDEKSRRFYALVALMLSSQTKDAVVAHAMQSMHEDGVLSVDGILALPREKLVEEYLIKVGFRNNKAKYLQETCEILQDEFGGDIPPTAKQMMDLPGVGPKMAYICENAAWRKQSGIGVDTHMHRIFPKLGWVDKQSKTPDHTRLALESWLPQKYWGDVNLLWVGFGQEVQQFPGKIMEKALSCSNPEKAIKLLKKCGMVVGRIAQRHGMGERYREVIKAKK